MVKNLFLILRQSTVFIRQPNNLRPNRNAQRRNLSWIVHSSLWLRQNVSLQSHESFSFPFYSSPKAPPPPSNLITGISRRILTSKTLQCRFLLKNCFTSATSRLFSFMPPISSWLFQYATSGVVSGMTSESRSPSSFCRRQFSQFSRLWDAKMASIPTRRAS